MLALAKQGRNRFNPYNVKDILVWLKLYHSMKRLGILYEIDGCAALAHKLSGSLAAPVFVAVEEPLLVRIEGC